MPGSPADDHVHRRGEEVRLVLERPRLVVVVEAQFRPQDHVLDGPVIQAGRQGRVQPREAGALPLDVVEKLQAREKKKAGTLARAFSTHPQTPDRITRSQEEISRILPARQQYIVTTSEFADVKARLASIENRRKLVDDKGGTKPSLRRTSTADKPSDKNGDKGGDDDRPTLHRRDD